MEEKPLGRDWKVRKKRKKSKKLFMSALEKGSAALGTPSFSVDGRKRKQSPVREPLPQH